MNRAGRFASWTLGLSLAVSSAASVGMLVRPRGLPVAWLGTGGPDAVVRAWALTWLAWSLVLLWVLRTAYRDGSPGARPVLATVPALWLSHLLLAPGSYPYVNLALALVTAVAVAAPMPRRRTAAPGRENPTGRRRRAAGSG